MADRIKDDALTEVDSTFYELGKKIKAATEAKDLLDESKLLQQLGDKYLELASRSHEGWHFVRACGLFNSARCCIDKFSKINPTAAQDELQCLRDDQTKAIDQVEYLYITHLLGCFPEYEVPKGTYKSRLTKIREYSKNSTDHIKEFMKVDISTADMQKDDEVKTIKASAKFYNELTEKLKDFYRGLLDDCFAVLGKPSCKYAILGLGSLARQEATAWSDLESAILFDDTNKSEDEITSIKTYFRTLSHLFHIKLINLGETILPSLCIPVLNDFNKELPTGLKNNEYFDDVTPSGVCFDGAMPWASKTPLGRRETDTKPPLELIMTARELAEQQREDVCMKEGYHLADVLMSTTLVDGDREMYEEYNKIVDSILQSPSTQDSTMTVARFRGIQTFIDDAENEKQKPFSLFSLERTLSAKKDIYRFATMSINSLKLIHGLSSTCPLDILDELVEVKKISESAAQDLKIMVCIAINLRHSVYAKKNRQHELISFIKSLEGSMGKLLSVRDYTAIYRFLFTFTPWIEDICNRQIPNKSFDLILPRYLDNTSLTKAKIHFFMNYHEHALKSLFILEKEALKQDNKAIICDVQIFIGCIFIRTGKHLESLEYLLKAYDISHELTQDNEVASLFCAIGKVYLNLCDYSKALEFTQKAYSLQRILYEGECNTITLETIYNLAMLKHYIGKNHEAIKMAENILEQCRIANRDNAFAMNLAKSLEFLAIIYQGVGGQHKAREYLTEELSILQNIYKDSPHDRLVMVYSLIGKSYLELEEFGSAMNYYQKAFKMAEGMYNMPQAQLVTALCGIALLYRRTGKHIKALDKYQKAYKMQSDISKNKADPNTADILNEIGMLHLDMGNHQLALDSHEKALEMLENVFPDRPHRGIACTLLCIGKVNNAMGQPKEALLKYDRCKIIYKEIHKESPHSNFANLLNLFGETYKTMGEFQEAKQYFEEAYQIEMLVHHNQTNHRLAKSLSYLASAYLDTKDESKALEYYEKAYKMYKQIYKDSPHCEIVQTLIGLAALMQQDYKKKLSYLFQAHQMLRSLFKEDPHQMKVRVLLLMGITYMNLKRPDTALRQLEQGIEMSKICYGNKKNEPELKLALEAMLAIHKSRNNVNKCIEIADALQQLKLK
ncbi:unnamed protein product [Owenia fusiformis]|uniref:Protein-PII uridylyltransferase N-terminal domain-containing protein n=1 Tax=Owenia fusiformis TaxID=6347 RepID=A0A8J1TYA8_OWEFU|nr:unnamed protein product [Owenia fusiformis]